MTVPGLYRYRSGDQVRGTRVGRHGSTVGVYRSRDLVCDLVGEKLEDTFVDDCLRQITVLP